MFLKSRILIQDLQSGLFLNEHGELVEEAQACPFKHETAIPMLIGRYTKEWSGKAQMVGCTRQVFGRWCGRRNRGVMTAKKKKSLTRIARYARPRRRTPYDYIYKRKKLPEEQPSI